MADAPHRKFGFDTEFDAGGGVAFAAPRPKRSYTPEEVEAIRLAALAEGERTGLASVAAEQARALSQIAAACGQALPRLAEVAHAHRVGSANLALACARAIADAALERFPEAPVRAAMEALAREIEAAPRLVVRAAPELADRLQAALDKVAEACGYAGQVTVKGEPIGAPAAFVFDWGEGRAAFDPEKAAERVAAAVRTALAAEGLHAEPLTPVQDADHG